MEKTDTIILSPEELAAYMAESTISVTSTYEHSPVVLMVDDTVKVSSELVQKSVPVIFWLVRLLLRERQN